MKLYKRYTPSNLSCWTCTGGCSWVEVYRTGAPGVIDARYRLAGWRLT